MTNHVKTRNELKQINKKADFNELLESAVLSEREKEVMRLYYLDKKDFGYIADILGYSKAGIVKMHKRILKRLETLI